MGDLPFDTTRGSGRRRTERSPGPRRDRHCRIWGPAARPPRTRL